MEATAFRYMAGNHLRSSISSSEADVIGCSSDRLTVPKWTPRLWQLNGHEAEPDELLGIKRLKSSY
jgi:hypothetical protein